MMSESEFSEPHEPADVEWEISPGIDALPETLGFIETGELVHLREQLVEASAAGSDTRELATHYHALAEEVVNQQEGMEFARAQIGLIVQEGLIRRDGGHDNAYIESLQDALMYAEGMGFEDIIAALQAVLSTES